MKYRKYQYIRGSILTLVMLSLGACASTGGRNPDSMNTDDESAPVKRERYLDGREPSSLQGDFTWLNDVENRFDKIAAETSHRTVASQENKKILLKRKNWRFSYLPKTNHFFLDMEGSTYKMIQTRINDGGRYAFAAEGQVESPLTFSVVKDASRSIASSDACETEVSYWSKKQKVYVTDRKTWKGKTCDRLLALLKDYVP